MRIMIKKLLKKHKYPPEGMDDAVQTVMLQCELWTDNNDMGARVVNYADRLNQYARESSEEITVSEDSRDEKQSEDEQIADLKSEEKKVERSNKTDLNIFAKRTIEIGEYMKEADDLNMAAENHIYEHKHPNE